MSNKRRFILIFISVGSGSLLSLWIVKKRMGVLKPEDYVQLGINFLFAAAIVVGIAIFLQRMNKKYTSDQQKTDASENEESK